MYDTLATVSADGVSRRDALGRILALRPDHELALRAMMAMELREDHAVAAAAWQRRLLAVSPLAKYISER